MKFLWCDIETTGIDFSKNAPFQIAFIFVHYTPIKKSEEKKMYYLNPFDLEGIEYSDEAGAIHGYSRDKIESFEDSKIVVKDIKEKLDKWFSINENEKIYFCGYNSEKFDYIFLDYFFNKYDINFSNYFQKQQLDVFNQVKTAFYKRKLQGLQNKKLSTVANYLGIKLDNAHDAMADITATREIAKSLSNMGIKLK